MHAVNTAHRRSREHRRVSTRTHGNRGSNSRYAHHRIGDRGPTGDRHCAPRERRRESRPRARDRRSRGGNEGSGSPLMAVVRQHPAEQGNGRCSDRHRTDRCGERYQGTSRNETERNPCRCTTSSRYDQTMVLHWRPATHDPRGWFELCTAWKVSVTVAEPPCRALGAMSGSR